jgi:hypothetical protein
LKRSSGRAIRRANTEHAVYSAADLARHLRKLVSFVVNAHLKARSFDRAPRFSIINIIAEAAEAGLAGTKLLA